MRFTARLRGPQRCSARFKTLQLPLSGGYEEGYADGKQAEYDRFWNGFQQNGERTDYAYAFFLRGWDGVFNPKYDLTPVNANNMFGNSDISNIEAALEDSGVVLDTFRCTNAYRMFCKLGLDANNIGYSSGCNNVVPELDLRNATNLTELFAYAKVHIIRKIILSDSGAQNTNYLLHGVTALEEVRFEGVIPGYAINLSSCKNLSMESVQSIIDHLKDLTGATACTLTLHATVGAKLTEEQKETIAAKNWTLVY